MDIQSDQSTNPVQIEVKPSNSKLKECRHHKATVDGGSDGKSDQRWTKSAETNSIESDHFLERHATFDIEHTANQLERQVLNSFNDNN